jgi:DNA recombination protein RmuC
MVWLAAAGILVLGIVLIGLILKISSQVNERLNQMNQSLQEANKIISQNLGGATQMYGTIHEKLGRLEESSRQLSEIGKDIVGLQELLRAPKFRGEFGELLLENLLSQVLPQGYYQMQYRFGSREAVDAVITLADKLVPIDAKFSLENFNRMVEAADEQAKLFYRRKFIQDVKTRIEEISSKYILPAENTYDFALMYVPAENIYYEVIIAQDLFAYAVAKKVFPVSPNTLYVYLQVICLGLRGFKVSEHAHEILKQLNALTIDIGKFREDFELMGNHLANASRKYEEGQKKLERFNERLVNLQDTKE